MAITPPAPADLSAFRQLSSRVDVANFFGTTLKRLNFHLYSASRPTYKFFLIEKSAGSARMIASPPPIVGAFQGQLLSCMTAMVVAKDICHGFVKGRSIVSNAKPHVRAEIVLNIDLADFFTTIHFGRVRGVFESRPFSFSRTVASLLAQVCCVDSVLPQGGPTSPMIANLVCRGLDSDLRRLTRRRGCTATRYADDITISSRRNTLPEEFLKSYVGPGDQNPVVGDALLHLIKSHGFSLNDEKTRVRTAAQRLVVTGLTVNRKPNVSFRDIRNLRACVHDWQSNGYKAAAKKFRAIMSTRIKFESHVKGKLNFMSMVRGSDDLTYTKYALAVQELAPDRKSVKIWGRAAARTDFLKHAIWIVVGRDGSGSVVCNGTAFSLAGMIVTARHVFESEWPVASWHLLQAHDPYTDYPISAYRNHSHFDITAVETSAPIKAVLHQGKDLADNAGVSIAGFPNWNSPADGIYRTSAAVAQKKTVSAVDFIMIDKNIHKGLSGGPVLDARGGVHGVMVYGDEGTSVKNAAIDVGHLTDVFGAPWEFV